MVFTGTLVVGENSISSTGGTDAFVLDFSADGVPGKLLRDHLILGSGGVCGGSS